MFHVVVATRQPTDIRPVLASYEGTDIAQEFIKRSQEHQRYKFCIETELGHHEFLSLYVASYLCCVYVVFVGRNN